MGTVTYNNQPAIHADRGAVPIEGTSHVYRVKQLLWPGPVEAAIQERLIAPSLHVCCGYSQLGDVRVDADVAVGPAVVVDAARLPFKNASFETVLCDPPYNGKMQWNHDLLVELSRVARRRIIFQHWFLPTDKLGRWKKNHRFVMTETFIWAPRTYFGRVQVISVCDREDGG